MLREDYTLYIYKSNREKTHELDLPVPGNKILYGDEELKTDPVVPEKQWKNVSICGIKIQLITANNIIGVFPD